MLKERVATSKERMMLEAYGICQDCTRIVSWKHSKCPKCGSKKIAIKTFKEVDAP